jgi:hypothetical protein
VTIKVTVSPTPTARLRQEAIEGRDHHRHLSRQTQTAAGSSEPPWMSASLPQQDVRPHARPWRQSRHTLTRNGSADPQPAKPSAVPVPVPALPNGAREPEWERPSKSLSGGTSKSALLLTCRIALEPTADYHRTTAYRLVFEGFEVVFVCSVAGAQLRDAVFNSWDKNDRVGESTICLCLPGGRAYAPSTCWKLLVAYLCFTVLASDVHCFSHLWSLRRQTHV